MACGRPENLWREGCRQRGDAVDSQAQGGNLIGRRARHQAGIGLRLCQGALESRHGCEQGRIIEVPRDGVAGELAAQVVAHDRLIIARSGPRGKQGRASGGLH